MVTPFVPPLPDMVHQDHLIVLVSLLDLCSAVLAYHGSRGHGKVLESQHHAAILNLGEDSESSYNVIELVSL